MAKRKIFALALAAMLFQSTVSASAYELQTYGGGTFQASHGTNTTVVDYSKTSASSTSTSSVGTDNSAWSKYLSFVPSARWQPYQVAVPNYSPWNGTNIFPQQNNNGIFPSIQQFTIPLSELDAFLSNAESAFSPELINAQYTMMNHNSPMFNGTDWSRTMNADTFFNTPLSITTPTGSFSDFSAYFSSSAPDEEKEMVSEMLAKALIKMYGVSEQTANDIAAAIKNGSSDCSDLLFAGFNNVIQFATLANMSPLTLDQIRDLLLQYLQSHGYPGTLNSNCDIDAPFWITNDGRILYNPMLYPNSNLELNGSVYTYDDIRTALDSYGQDTFSDDLVTGGVKDAYTVQNRTAIVREIYNILNNAGIDTVDVTNIVDYRIKSLLIGKKSDKEYTERFRWTVYRLDETGAPTAIYQRGTSADNIYTDTFSYRFTSAGKYLVKAEREYATILTNSVEAYATEYTFLSDTGDLLTSEQYFTPGGKYDVVDIVQDRETNIEWETCDTFDVNVTDAQVDKIMYDFSTGDVIGGFDTERIE